MGGEVRTIEGVAMEGEPGAVGTSEGGVRGSQGRTKAKGMERGLGDDAGMWALEGNGRDLDGGRDAGWRGMRTVGVGDG